MLNDNVPAGSQILPFYLADGSSDVALIRGRMASIGPAASGIIINDKSNVTFAHQRYDMYRFIMRLCQLHGGKLTMILVQRAIAA